jgi:hypothetical protein
MTHTDKQLRQFLLHRLAEEESRAIEDAILLEDEVAERLRAEELDLFSDYATGRLSASERADVEQNLLTSGGAAHSLRIAGLLARQGRLAPGAIQPTGRLRHRYFAPPHRAAFAALISITVLAVLILPRWRTEPSLPSSPNSMIVSNPAPGNAAKVSARPPSPIPVLTLLMDVNRGASQPAPAWPRASQVRLEAEVPAGAEGPFILTIEDAHGYPQFQSGELTARAVSPYRYVEAVVPTQALANGINAVVLRSANAPLGAPPTFHWEIAARSSP